MNSYQRNKIRKRRLKIGRVRAKIFGTAKKPRAAVYRSLKHIYIQFIDDEKGKTMAGASDREAKKGLAGVNQAKAVGKIAAEKALTKKITQVVFDRRFYKYHGRIKALADGMREGGLQF